MRRDCCRWLFCAAALAAILMLSGCGKDPVVGKWVDTQYREQTWEFRADGTATWSMDFEKMRGRLNAKYPGYQAAVNASIEKKRRQLQEFNTDVHWVKAAGGYNVTTRTMGAMPCRIVSKNVLDVNDGHAFIRVAN